METCDYAYSAIQGADGRELSVGRQVVGSSKRYMVPEYAVHLS